MATFLILLQLAIVLAMIFIGAKKGGIGLGIYGMVGVFILVFVFGEEPGAIPIDVMLIIVSVITASAALQAAGGLDYMVNVAARFLKKHPSHITFYAPLVTWLFSLCTGTAHTCYVNAGGMFSKRQGRSYPREKWVELGNKLAEKLNASIILNGAKEDKEFLKPLEGIKKSINFI